MVEKMVGLLADPMVESTAVLMAGKKADLMAEQMVHLMVA